MFKTNFSWHNTFGGHKKLERTALECSPMQSSINLHTPNWNWGGAYAVIGAQNSVPSPLNPPKIASNPKLKYETVEISEVGSALKEKCLYITVILSPFESKTFTHYNCCWRSLWKRSEPAYTLHLLLWASLKA